MSDRIDPTDSSRPTAVKTGQFHWHGHRLAYELYGDTGKPCLLVHGILVDAYINHALALRFAAEGYQVALLDLFGHGRSDKSTDPTDYRVDLYAEQVLGALDHLGWERALVGGVSLGAITALQLAALAPQRLSGLFLEMPVMERSAAAAALMLTPLMQAVYYGARLYRPFARLLRRLPRPRTDWIASVLNGASQDPAVISAILHGIIVGPLVPPLAVREAITVPTLVIGHRYDWLHELGDARALAQQIPHAQLIRARSILELRTQASLERLWPQVQSFLHSMQPPAVATAARTRRPSRSAAKPHGRKSSP